MTSNIGSDIIQEYVDDSQYPQMKARVIAELGNHFKPEFINRIDETVVFHPLLAEQIKSIASIQISALTKRLEERDITMTLSKEALSFVAAVGFDPIFGARPLKRSIRQEIENPLAHKLLANEFSAGDHIFVELVDNNLHFIVKA
jgi:ATP-dependent Clp protease ATP-binding subunit ClpB